jgi:hypothetical protein
MYAVMASAAGVGMLALSQPAEAKIVYSPAHKLIESGQQRRTSKSSGSPRTQTSTGQSGFISDGSACTVALEAGGVCRVSAIDGEEALERKLNLAL